jgi:hypothetical protein
MDFIFFLFSRIIKAKNKEIMYIVIEIHILFKLMMIINNDSIIQIESEIKNAIITDLKTRIANITKNNMLIPNSAGITDADFEAKFTSLVIAKKTRAITIVDGNVPRIPPIFVPYFSAIAIISTTIIADKIKGKNN